MAVLRALAILLMLVPLAVTATFKVEPTDAFSGMDRRSDELSHDIPEGGPGLIDDDNIEQLVNEVHLDFIEYEMPVCLEGACDVSEIRRRLASRSRYISYDSLKKYRVPCYHRGKSYYNCQRGRQVNPYRRGCSFITRCARIMD